ncbi:glycerate kinase [Agromyces humatus]|uniref:Glycerate kinase n=1 Tax=Agromyces humatus TaxID=279573 RepID=A0ABN2KYP8_9MICO|nr:glycerate kinase [Agromyces humatus]
MSPARGSAEPIRVVIAPDSFKGSIGAASAASALAEGWRSVRPDDEILLKPMADGGEGTLDAFDASVAGAERIPVTVSGPDDVMSDASWLLLPPTPEAPAGTGVIDLASTSGIELLGGHLRAWDAHTLGFGQAMRAALGYGVSRLVLGIGSSASTDGGMGALTALGARFMDAAGDPCAPGARGLTRLASVELSDLVPLPEAGVIVLSDVPNPLVGPTGAAAVFGPQKGLDPGCAEVVDAGLARLATLLGVDPASPGAGAAGGTGMALIAWGAQLLPGAAQVAEVIGLSNAVASATVVITGEGSYDGQSAAGKVPAFIVRLAAESGAATVLVAGRIAPDADLAPFAIAESLSRVAGSPAEAQRHAEHWLVEAGRRTALAFEHRPTSAMQTSA